MSGTEVKDEMDEMDYDEDDETEEEEALDEAEEDVKSMGSRMEKLFEISRRPLQGNTNQNFDSNTSITYISVTIYLTLNPSVINHRLNVTKCICKLYMT